MVPAPLRKAGYALTAAYGLFAALAPRMASSLTTRMGLLGFENTSKLEAEDWYIRAVRAAGVGMIAAGGVGLLLEDRAADSEEPPAVETATDEADIEEESDEPVDIDV